jgi:hypothetical protein
VRPCITRSAPGVLSSEEKGNTRRYARIVTYAVNRIQTQGMGAAAAARKQDISGDEIFCYLKFKMMHKKVKLVVDVVVGACYRARVFESR